MNSQYQSIDTFIHTYGLGLYILVCAGFPFQISERKFDFKDQIRIQG